MTPKCPKCRKASVKPYRPFCSKRCSDLDLGSWLNGNYRLPSDEEVSFEEFESELANDANLKGKIN
jgi:endogenous inhibitor of DNA gyrase (YacG/DUF329 family)